MDGENNTVKAFSGLTAQEVAERAADGRINGDQNIKTKSVWEIIRTNAFTFFNFLFLALAVVLVFFVDKNMAGFANFGFMFVVIINFFVGITQELKAKRTIDKLSLISAPKALVIRDGEEKDIAVKDIVLDDIIILSSGDQISADSVVQDGTIEVNESLLTGESDPVTKSCNDEILSGSFVVSGRAVTKVIRVGKDNYATKISAGAKYIKAPNSVILRSVSKFIKIMAAVILPLGIALFCVKYFAHGAELKSNVVTVIGNIIGMIPSGLMLLTTGVFCLSVIRLASYKALAQDLYCTETLARVDVLCLDKTGTITEGRMEVTDILPSGISDEEMKVILKNLMISIGDENPTSDAVKNYVKDIEQTQKALEITPFSSARKWSGAVFEDGSYAIGAAEFLIRKKTKKMDKELKEFSEKGKRVLVLVSSPSKIAENTLPKNLKFLGYVLISDTIRKEAPDTLRFFREQGVTIKIISGDNPVTVKSIAKDAGLEDAENYVDASTLTDDDMLKEAAEKYTVFGRVTPDQKLKLVKALKAAGHTVAMTGDGVNDVLALKESDCSVAMASGSDAAKNVSQLVLLDSNFASMPKIVAEGRRSINNLERSSSLFLVKTGYNFFFALIFLIIQSNLPFAPKHLTLLGIVTIGIPSTVLALEPNKERVTGKFLSKVITNALPASVTIAISVLAVFLLAPLFNLSNDQMSTTSLVVTAAVGFAYLAKISYPFNALRISLIIAMIGIFIGAFFADFGFIDLKVFFGLTGEITIDMLKVMIPVSILSVPLFFFIYFISKKFNRFHLIEKSLKKIEII